MKRIHFGVGSTVQIRSGQSLRRPFHTWPVPPTLDQFSLCGIDFHQERGDGMLYNNMHTSMLKALTALQTRQPSIRDAQLSTRQGFRLTMAK